LSRGILNKRSETSEVNCPTVDCISCYVLYSDERDTAE
jgi:hypothetical protein